VAANRADKAGQSGKAFQGQRGPTMTQLYLDFATPALAAGAVHRKGYWSMPGSCEQYGFVSHFCQSHNIEPVKIDPPKARSLAAIRRAQLAALHAGNDPKGRDGLAMRAMQYALAMNGIETRYRDNPYNAAKHCEFAKAADGSTRVRSVNLDSGRFDIPNWDFVAETVEQAEISAMVAIGYEPSAARYELNTRAQIAA
jgi:hypothetical protein